jgi:hypothetical protein
MVFMIIGPRQTTGVLSSTRKPMLITFTPWRSSGTSSRLDLGPTLDAHHERDAGTVDIAIHQAHAAGAAFAREHLGERAGEVDGKGALADAAFARGDGDGVFDRLGCGTVAREIAAVGGGGRGGFGRATATSTKVSFTPGMARRHFSTSVLR